ncbi:MAG: M50 family metallopeptidase [Rhizobacter sp.]|nr:M50 family metallopeptidase [Chlorobiales bacterium]
MKESITSSPDSPSVLTSGWFVASMALASMLLVFVPYGNYALLPFRFFTTFVHELGHAAASVLLGGSVMHIVINPDASGYMQYQGVENVLLRGAISSAGYLGAAFFGGLLLVLSVFRTAARTVLIVIASGAMLVLIFYIRDVFSFAVCFGLAAVIGWIGAKGSAPLNIFTVNFLAAQSGLNALSDVITLLRLSLGAQRSTYSLGHSDADAVAQLFFLPPVFWSVLWIALSLVILFVAIRIRLRLAHRKQHNRLAV